MSCHATSCHIESLLVVDWDEDDGEGDGYDDDEDAHKAVNDFPRVLRRKKGSRGQTSVGSHLNIICGPKDTDFL
jgi:hypothetical protein